MRKTKTIEIRNCFGINFPYAILLTIELSEEVNDLNLWTMNIMEITSSDNSLRNNDKIGKSHFLYNQKKIKKIQNL